MDIVKEKPILKIKYIATNGIEYEKVYTNKNDAAFDIDMANAVGAKIVDIEQM